jgi:hypothetical protein
VCKTFTSTELQKNSGLVSVALAVTRLLEECNIQAVLSDVVCKLLELTLWPPLDATKELSLVSLVEVFDGLLELNLSSPQWMDLHELLQVEEGLTD